MFIEFGNLVIVWKTKHYTIIVFLPLKIKLFNMSEHSDVHKVLKQIQSYFAWISKGFKYDSTIL